MFTIGLTGGIGSGKSTVAAYFMHLGVPVIDADVIARQLVTAGSPALRQIQQHFGDSILQADGELDRSRLREFIFKTPSERKWLENLLHPLIREEILRRLVPIKAPYCVIVIPLLVEYGGYPWLDRILVVDCPEAIQIERASARDKADRTQIMSIIDQQAARKTRLACADDVIHNIEGLETLESQVRQLHHQYLKLATG